MEILLALLALLLGGLLSRAKTGLDGVIVARDLLRRLFCGGFFLFLFELFRLAPDHELRADARDALRAERRADLVRRLAGGQPGRLQHAALDKLMAVEERDRLVKKRFGNAALADDERHVERIGLCALFRAFLTCHHVSNSSR